MISDLHPMFADNAKINTRETPKSRPKYMRVIRRRNKNKDFVLYKDTLISTSPAFTGKKIKDPELLAFVVSLIREVEVEFPTVRFHDMVTISLGDQNQTHPDSVVYTYTYYDTIPVHLEFLCQGKWRRDCLRNYTIRVRGHYSPKAEWNTSNT